MIMMVGSVFSCLFWNSNLGDLAELILLSSAGTNFQSFSCTILLVEHLQSEYNLTLYCIIPCRYSDTSIHGRYTYPRSIGFSDFKKKEKKYRYTTDTPPGRSSTWLGNRNVGKPNQSPLVTLIASALSVYLLD
jgi:hypothetical protein